MSKLDQLIAELCPNGVEFVQLADVASYSSVRVSAEKMTSETYVGVDNLLPEKQGKTLSSYVPQSGMLTGYESGDILIGNIRPYLKKIWLADCSGGTNGDVLVIHIANNLICSEYLYYILSADSFFAFNMQNAKGAKMPRGSKSSIMQYTFQLPPITVQHYIVQILDKFTKLQAELQAELQARITQYEYYRNSLLSFGVVERERERERESRRITWLPLGEIAKLIRGTYVTKNKTVRGNIPVILGGQEPAYYCDRSNHEGEAIVISRSGAYAGFVSFWNEPIFVTDGFILEANENLTMKYLFYYLKNMQNALYDMKRGGGVPHVRGNEIMMLRIAVPSLDEQEKILSILDRFDTLISNLADGLPAEINARRKQYEYYRDKLLTFEERTT
jgi:type I restriction enzyme S subunit